MAYSGNRSMAAAGTAGDMATDTAGTADTATTSAAAVTAVTAAGDGAVTGPGMPDGVWVGLGDTRMITATITRIPATITIPTRRPVMATAAWQWIPSWRRLSSLRTHRQRRRRPREDQQGANEALQFYSEARTAFLEGDYHNALRLGGHAAVDAPRNPKVHELISLALFALGNYRPAASEAHAAMALGAIADWKDLYAYYNDANKYTTQLRALEKAAESNPKNAADHFLLGYQYLMTGARDNAKTEFADAVKLTPKDKLASHYLQELQSNSPLTPPADGDETPRPIVVMRSRIPEAGPAGQVNVLRRLSRMIGKVRHGPP